MENASAAFLNAVARTRAASLTRLSEGSKDGLTGVVSELAREMRQSDISGHQSIAQCKVVADGVRIEARRTGVNLAELTPRIDVQRQRRRN
jgi:hypothetical protein